MTIKTAFADPANSPAAIVFTRPTCGPCGMTIRVLRAAGVTVEVRDLMTHLDDAARLRDAGHMQAPVVEPLNPAIPAWSGFDPNRIASLAAMTRTR